MIKSQTRLLDIETNEEWLVQARTRGQDVQRPGMPAEVTWILILHNKKGHRRFVPEARVAEFFNVPEGK